MRSNKKRKMNANYIDKNRDAWNKKTTIHITSDFYDNQSFLDGRKTLNDIEILLLGDVRGKSILHLQCHFGVDFICCDIYDLPQCLDKTFDIVFTSYGVIGWLPDLNKWANIISRYLKPNGKFVMVEFHPFIWIYDNDFQAITYNYFNVEEIKEELTGTYGDRDADISYSTTTWNHPTSEVLNSLIDSGITIENFNEYNYSPYNCFNHTIKIADNKYQIERFGDKIPMVFSILGKKQ